MHPRIRARIEDDLAKRLLELDGQRVAAIETLRRLRASFKPAELEAEPDLADEIERMMWLLEGIDTRSAFSVARDRELLLALENFATALASLTERHRQVLPQH